MLFNSAVFIVLFFLVYLVYWELSLQGKQNLIIVASLIFYGWYSPPFLLLFLVLIVVNYYGSMALLRRRSKALLWSLILLDGGILAFFKYFYLFAETAGWIVGWDYLAHLEKNWIRDHDFHIGLPIAISFYTFQIIAFVADCYRGTIRERVEPKKFYLFILFFPQFVAGPIMRSTDFLPQIDRPVVDPRKLLSGSLLLLQGVVKKVLIADRIGALTAPIWAEPSKYDAVFLILILPAFIAQVYLDFSGYTDMARGLARALGYDIPENFKGPFLATSMQELWQRWHVTLSTWLRDYIYIPLGGSRSGEVRTTLNLLATMALGGLWHGASWNMLFWGLYVGVLLAGERLLRRAGIRILPEGRLFHGVRVAITFSLFALSSLFFASPDLTRTTEIIQGILHFQRGLPGKDGGGLLALTLVAYLFNVPQYYPGVTQRIRDSLKLQYGLTVRSTFLVGYLVSLYGDVTGSFIYFQF